MENTFVLLQNSNTRGFIGLLSAKSKEQAITILAERLKSQGFDRVEADYELGSVFFSAWFDERATDDTQKTLYAQRPGDGYKWNTNYITIDPAETWKF